MKKEGYRGADGSGWGFTFGVIAFILFGLYGIGSAFLDAADLLLD